MIWELSSTPLSFLIINWELQTFFFGHQLPTHSRDGHWNLFKWFLFDCSWKFAEMWRICHCLTRWKVNKSRVWLTQLLILQKIKYWLVPPSRPVLRKILYTGKNVYNNNLTCDCCFIAISKKEMYRHFLSYST